VRSYVAGGVSRCFTVLLLSDAVKDAAVEQGVITCIVKALQHGHTLADDVASLAIAESALTALCSVCANHGPSHLVFLVPRLSRHSFWVAWAEANTAAAKGADVSAIITAVQTRFPVSPVVTQRGMFALALFTD
jgi:hypothetical protein